MLAHVTAILPFVIISIYSSAHRIQEVEESMSMQHNQTRLHGHPQGLGKREFIIEMGSHEMGAGECGWEGVRIAEQIERCEGTVRMGAATADTGDRSTSTSFEVMASFVFSAFSVVTCDDGMKNGSASVLFRNRNSCEPGISMIAGTYLEQELMGYKGGFLGYRGGIFSHSFW